MIANNWKIMAKTELTCTGNRILKKGITEMDCLDIAENNNRSFIWYARKTAQFQQPEVCAVYESCDLKKGGRLPTRPGHTGAIIDSTHHIFRFQFRTITIKHFNCIVKIFINSLHL